MGPHRILLGENWASSKRDNSGMAWAPIGLNTAPFALKHASYTPIWENPLGGGFNPKTFSPSFERSPADNWGVYNWGHLEGLLEYPPRDITPFPTRDIIFLETLGRIHTSRNILVGRHTEIVEGGSQSPKDTGGSSFINQGEGVNTPGGDRDILRGEPSRGTKN